MNIVRIEKIFLFIVSIMVCCFVCRLFYDTLYVGVILFVPSYYLIRQTYIKSKKKKWKKEFENQFEEALSGLASALQTGYSVENAFFEVKRQLELIYSKDAYIIKELHVICHGLSVNIPIEKLVNDMAVRTGVPAVSEFAEVLRIAKKGGGNFIEVTKQHANILHDKRQVINEIETVVSAKKYESIVMNVMPAGMLMYLRLTSGQFVGALYSGIISRIVMTALLCLYVVTIALGRYITNFENSGRMIKNVKAGAGKKKKGKANLSENISLRMYSMLKKTFLTAHIDRMNSEIRILYVNKRNDAVIREFWSDMIKKTMLAVIAGAVIIMYTLLNDRDNIMFYIIISCVVIYIIPYFVVNGIKSKSEKRRIQMMIDYPELIDRLSLLIGAGLSVKGCFIKIAGEYAAKKKNGLTGYHYLYEEITYIVRQVENGKAEAPVYEEFGKRSGLLSYMKLSTMLVQNLKKGNRDMLDKLRLTSLDALEERKNVMKQMGEKASSKLLMPMMLQFIMILVIIMYPAIVNM